jgi:hypothetical protein
VDGNGAPVSQWDPELLDICGPRGADVGGSRSRPAARILPHVDHVLHAVINGSLSDVGRTAGPRPSRAETPGEEDGARHLPAMTTSKGYDGEDPDRHSRPPRLRKGGRRPPPDPRRDGGRRRQRTCRQVEALADDEDNAHTASTESSTTTDAEAVKALPNTVAHPRNLRPRRRLARFPSGTKGAQKT